MKILIKSADGATKAVDFDGNRASLNNKPLICGSCVKPLIEAKTYDQRKSGAWDYRPEFHLEHEGDALVCPTCGTRRAIVNPDKNPEFRATTDNETGITYYELKHQVSPQSWRRVAHLFERDVELDCPDGRDWNDSITLKWATRQPAKVQEILSAE